MCRDTGCSILYHPRPQTSFKKVFIHAPPGLCQFYRSLHYPLPLSLYCVSGLLGEVRSDQHAAHAPAPQPRARGTRQPRERTTIPSRHRAETLPDSDAYMSPNSRTVQNWTLDRHLSPTWHPMPNHSLSAVPPVQPCGTCRLCPTKEPAQGDPGWRPTQMNQTHALHPLGTRSSRSNPRIPVEKPYLLESPHLGPHGCV